MPMVDCEPYEASTDANHIEIVDHSNTLLKNELTDHDMYVYMYTQWL